MDIALYTATRSDTGMNARAARNFTLFRKPMSIWYLGIKPSCLTCKSGVSMRIRSIPEPESKYFHDWCVGVWAGPHSPLVRGSVGGTTLTSGAWECGRRAGPHSPVVRGSVGGTTLTSGAWECGRDHTHQWCVGVWAGPHSPVVSGSVGGTTLTSGECVALQLIPFSRAALLLASHRHSM